MHSKIVMACVSYLKSLQAIWQKKIKNDLGDLKWLMSLVCKWFYSI